jgi:hypothetical protein
MSAPEIASDLFGNADVTVPACQRSRVTNDPMARHRGKSADARRVRDLYLSYMGDLGNPVNAAVQARVAKAAELVVAAEIARAKLIEGGGDANQLVRLENLADRAVRSLGILKANAAPAHVPLRDRLSAEARPAEPPALSLRERLAGAPASPAEVA